MRRTINDRSVTSDKANRSTKRIHNDINDRIHIGINGKKAWYLYTKWLPRIE